VPCVQINKYAFSGGGATVEEHRARGANLAVDVPWKYLNFFLEDDAKLATIGEEYGAGRMLTGEAMDPVVGIFAYFVSVVCCNKKQEIVYISYGLSAVTRNKKSCGLATIAILVRRQKQLRSAPCNASFHAIMLSCSAEPRIHCPRRRD
jgi:hypothetical protein